MSNFNFNLNLNEQMLRSLRIAKDCNIPVCFLSNPGFGKTTLINWYANKMGMNLVMLRGSDYQPEDILGFPRDNNGHFDRLLPSWYVQLFEDQECTIPKKNPSLLFIDEITTASPYTQAALLSVIFERKLVDRKLPDNTFVVAAGNYSLNLSDQFNLISPIVNRFMFVNLKATNEDIDLFLGLLDGYEPFDPYTAVKSELSPEMRVQVATRIANLVKDMQVDLNEVDLKDIYMNQEYVKNASTLRSLHYLNQVSISIIENDLMHPMLFKTLVDGLFGYGLDDFGNRLYAELKDIVPEGFVDLSKVVDFKTLTLEDLLDSKTGEPSTLFRSMSSSDFMSVNDDVFNKVISRLIGCKLSASKNTDFYVIPEDMTKVLKEKASQNSVNYDLWKVLSGEMSVTDLQNQ